MIVIKHSKLYLLGLSSLKQTHKSRAEVEAWNTFQIEFVASVTH